MCTTILYRLAAALTGFGFALLSAHAETVAALLH